MTTATTCVPRPVHLTRMPAAKKRLTPVVQVDTSTTMKVAEDWMPGPAYCMDKSLFSTHIEITSTAGVRREFAKLIENLTDGVIDYERVAPVPSNIPPPIKIPEVVYRRYNFVPQDVIDFFYSLSLPQVEYLSSSRTIITITSRLGLIIRRLFVRPRRA